MTVTTAIKTDLRLEILRILRQDINYQVQAGDGGDIIQPTSVLYQKTRLQKSRSFEQANQQLDYPGIIVCDPRRTVISQTEGTNERDLWHYNWMIQIVDKDLWNDEDRIATWERWVEQIVSALIYTQINEVVQLPKGQIQFTFATPVNDIDESEWIRDSQFITGIEVEVGVLQPRGIS